MVELETKNYYIINTFRKKKKKKQFYRLYICIYAFAYLACQSLEGEKARKEKTERRNRRYRPRKREERKRRSRRRGCDYINRLQVHTSFLESEDMPPASKSKSKSRDKASVRVQKEHQEGSCKLSGSTSTGNGGLESGYNPISGIFHTVDTAPMSSSPPLHNNCRFQNIDGDEHSGSLHGTGPEYDSVSNNGSSSGESEDHKEKAAVTPRQETIPGSANDKREKIRQKNERKHQRQREKRAQELHKRCTDYLMSRKLETLCQQLVAMGFSSERATLALMLNEGRVEESVSWLFEGSEEANKDAGSKTNLKIDISEELAQITALEIRFKCSKQEVERAVVTCEGNLVKAEEILRAQKPETPPVTPQKAEETANTKHSTRLQEKPMAPVKVQQRRDERNPNYVRGSATVPTFSESCNRNLQISKTNQPNLIPEKRWHATGSSSSVSYSGQLSPTQVAPTLEKMEAQHGVCGHEWGVVRDSVTLMQRPHSVNIKQNLVSSFSSSPPMTTGPYLNNDLVVESMKLNNKLLHNQNTIRLGQEYLSSEHFNPHTQHIQRRHISSSMDSAASRMGISWSKMGTPSPSLAVPSSLGLFSGWGSTGTLGLSSQVDWSKGDLMSHCDYNNIDWTLDSSPASSKRNGLILRQSDRLMLGFSSVRMAGRNGSCIVGLQDGGMASEATASAGLRDWTSPFAGKDIFNVPRQLVTSPSP